MPDYKERMAATVLHTVFGAAVGYLSKDILAAYGGAMVAFVGAVTLVIMNQFVKYILKKHDFTWWMGNGIWPYLTTWFAVWTFVINM